MGVSAECDFFGEFSYYYYSPDKQETLKTKKSRTCQSCNCVIKVGDKAMKYERFREPKHEIEERIYGDEYPLAPYFHCEVCGDLDLALREQGLCFTLGDNLKKEISIFNKQSKKE